MAGKKRRSTRATRPRMEMAPLTRRRVDDAVRVLLRIASHQHQLGPHEEVGDYDRAVLQNLVDLAEHVDLEQVGAVATGVVLGRDVRAYRAALDVEAIFRDVRRGLAPDDVDALADVIATVLSSHGFATTTRRVLQFFDVSVVGQRARSWAGYLDKKRGPLDAALHFVGIITEAGERALKAVRRAESSARSGARIDSDLFGDPLDIERARLLRYVLEVCGIEEERAEALVATELTVVPPRRPRTPRPLPKGDDAASRPLPTPSANVNTKSARAKAKADAQRILASIKKNTSRPIE